MIKKDTFTIVFKWISYNVKFQIVNNLLNIWINCHIPINCFDYKIIELKVINLRIQIAYSQAVPRYKFYSVMNKLQNCRNLFKQLHRNQSIWTEPKGYETGISIFNCTARKKVPLVLRRKNVATWYACGPTVYDTAHIGHASCYVKQDIVQRILKDYFHINLVTAMNVTNIDDKIIKRSAELNEDWMQLAKRYEMEFWKDLTRLHVREPNLKCRVSDYIDQIIQFIENLIKNQSAYVTDDGSVYFELNRYKKYGKLQNLNLEQETKHEVKRSALDFALWKASKSSSEPSWLPSWHTQEGRPGWHIECSAMASHLFGSEIDFHSGGLDLRFPHHENEEAQSCAHHGCEQWVNYWLHTGQLHVEGDASKMSKSLKNTISISEMLEKYSAEQFRMLCLLTNYNNQMEYGKDSMDLATSLWKKLQMFQLESKSYVQGLKPLTNFCSESLYNEVGHTARFIDEALRDNFNTARCIDHIMNLITFTNK